MLAAFQIFDSYSWAKLLFIGSAAAIVIFAAILNKGKLRVRLSMFHLLLLAFVVYLYLNSLWSQNNRATSTMARTCFRNWVCFGLLYIGLINTTDVKKLLTAVLAASYIVMLYSYAFYGIGNVLDATQNTRLSTLYANINSISIFLNIGVIIDLYLLLEDGFRLYRLLSIASIVFIAASQTRKTVIVMFVAAAVLIMMHNLEKKDSLHVFLKILAVSFCAVMLLLIAQHLQLFSGVNERIDEWTNSFTGNGKVDNSSHLRSEFIRIGIESWWQHPIGGVGVGTTGMISMQEMFVNSYLHNNYVELLCGGGIIAFLLYYSMHAYLAVKLILMRRSNYAVFTIGIVLLGMILLLDYSSVSYYIKTNMFELMLLFILVDQRQETVLSG